MGNTTSDVNDSIKAQADSENGPELYKLVNVNEGGILARLLKTALKNKDYRELDEFIQTEVVKYLYNNGNGEHIPIEKIIQKKAGNKARRDSLEGQNEKITKEICFDIDKVGAVGETLLHLCMLNGTPLFIELAKRLIKHFPKMVNDIYLSEDYYGETALHMAIVSEDPTMVRHLLLNGADVHQRCNGKFFCPEDQKNNQIHSVYQEEPILPVYTNYVGYVYYGEYPLSFAAILNQEVCVNLLLVFGADPNRQDSNGNTVLHMLVINNNLKMFQNMLENNASLHIKNKQGLTPLTLAAKLAKKEMFQFILEQLRTVWFTYADISFGSYPLSTIDTIADDGSTDVTSAIYLVVNGETTAHLDLLEGFIVEVIDRKWNTYIKNKFYLEVLFYAIYYILSIIAILLKRLYFDHLSNDENAVEEEKEYSKLKQEFECAYLYPSDSNRYLRITLEFIVLLYSIMYLIIMASELYIQKISLYVKTLVFNPFKVVFLFGPICYLMIIPFRLTCDPVTEDILTALAIIFQSAYALYLGRGFRIITTYVFIIHRVFRTNFLRFIIIFFVFMLGFSQAFYVAFEFGNEPKGEVFYSPMESIFDLIVMTLDAQDRVYTVLLTIENKVVSNILFFIFLVMVPILLVNLLIAMMRHTYVVTTTLKREWLRQWAKQILAIESNVYKKERLKHQKKYSSVLRTGEKCFLVRWKISDKEKQELKENKYRFRDVVSKVQKMGPDME